MNQLSYTDLKNIYDENHVFSTLSIDLYIAPTTYDDTTIYQLTNVSCNELSDRDELIWHNQGFKEILEKVPNYINDLKVTEPHSSSKIRKSWSVFYTLKEIIDDIRAHAPDDCIPYFRGQNNDWPLMPTILRDTYSDKFRENFEIVYQDIARKYPSFVKYYPVGSNDRLNNLAELQHYGLGTPLVDLTDNPFIAMIFMSNGFKKTVKSKNPWPKLEMFFIKKDGKHKLFQEAQKNSTNLRIDAQRGAFLNFDRLSNNTTLLHEDSDNAICRVSMRILTTSSDIPEKLSSLVEEQDVDETVAEEKVGFTENEQALIIAMKDTEKKLKSFNYAREDLFPDFDRYLQYLKNEYETIDNPEPGEWFRYAKNTALD